MHLIVQITEFHCTFMVYSYYMFFFSKLQTKGVCVVFHNVFKAELRDPPKKMTHRKFSVTCKLKIKNKNLTTFKVEV